MMEVQEKRKWVAVKFLNIKKDHQLSYATFYFSFLPFIYQTKGKIRSLFSYGNVI